MRRNWRGILDLVAFAVIAACLAVGFVWATIKILDFLK